MKKKYFYGSLLLVALLSISVFSCYKKQEIDSSEGFKLKEREIISFLSTIRPNKEDIASRSKCSVRCNNGSCSISCKTSNCGTACGCDDRGFPVCQVAVFGGVPMPSDPNIGTWAKITVDELQQENILSIRNYLYQNQHYVILDKFDSIILSYNSGTYQNNIERFNILLNNLTTSQKEEYRAFIKNLPK